MLGDSKKWRLASNIFGGADGNGKSFSVLCLLRAMESRLYVGTYTFSFLFPFLSVSPLSYYYSLITHD